MRIYATDERGEKFLRYIECDRCDARLKPGPHVVESGWIKRGWSDGFDEFETDLCPEHSME